MFNKKNNFQIHLSGGLPLLAWVVDGSGMQVSFNLSTDALEVSFVRQHILKLLSS